MLTFPASVMPITFPPAVVRFQNRRRVLSKIGNSVGSFFRIFSSSTMEDEQVTSSRPQSEHIEVVTSPANSSSGQSPTRGSPLHASIFQVTSERKAKRVRFFRNGDRFYAGLLFAVSQDRYRTLDSLMADLTASPVCDRRILPQGIRHIFTVDGTRKISSIGQLEEGQEYVCSSSPNFRRTEYPKSGFAFWNMNRGSVYHLSGSTSSRLGPESPVSTGECRSGPSSIAPVSAERDFVRPRIVTVIRNGGRPRKCFRLLLNRKTAHSLPQVLADITEMIKPDFGNVRKVFAISGKQVLSVASQAIIFLGFGWLKKRVAKLT